MRRRVMRRAQSEKNEPLDNIYARNDDGVRYRGLYRCNAHFSVLHDSNWTTRDELWTAFNTRLSRFLMMRSDVFL